MILQGLKIQLDTKLIGRELDQSIRNSEQNLEIYLSQQNCSCRKARALSETDGTVTMKHPHGENERPLFENRDNIENRPCSKEFIPPRMTKPRCLQQQGQMPAICDDNDTNYPSKRRRIQKISTVTIEEID